MNFEVRYFSRSGNTKKIAEAIAEAAGCKALSIDHPVKNETDLLFLGAAVYAAGVGPKIKEFINSLDGNVKRVAVFSTAAIITSAYPEVKKLLEAKGIAVDIQEFHCRGKFTLLHAKHPNATDIEGAKAFAKQLLKKQL